MGILPLSVVTTPTPGRSEGITVLIPRGCSGRPAGALFSLKQADVAGSKGTFWGLCAGLQCVLGKVAGVPVANPFTARERGVFWGALQTCSCVQPAERPQASWAPWVLWLSLHLQKPPSPPGVQ